MASLVIITSVPFFPVSADANPKCARMAQRGRETLQNQNDISEIGTDRLCGFPTMKLTFKNIQEALKFILNFKNDEVIACPKVIIMPFFYQAPVPAK